VLRLATWAPQPTAINLLYHDADLVAAEIEQHTLISNAMAAYEIK